MRMILKNSKKKFTPTNPTRINVKVFFPSALAIALIGFTKKIKHPIINTNVLTTGANKADVIIATFLLILLSNL